MGRTHAGDGRRLRHHCAHFMAPRTPAVCRCPAQRVRRCCTPPGSERHRVGGPPMTTVLDQLQNISRDLDAAIRDLSRLEQEAATAESDYRVTKAKAFMRASGSVQAREYTAVIEAEIQLINRDKTAAL